MRNFSLIGSVSVYYYAGFLPLLVAFDYIYIELTLRDGEGKLTKFFKQFFGSFLWTGTNAKFINIIIKMGIFILFLILLVLKFFK